MGTIQLFQKPYYSCISEKILCAFADGSFFLESSSVISPSPGDFDFLVLAARAAAESNGSKISLMRYTSTKTVECRAFEALIAHSLLEYARRPSKCTERR